MKNTKKLLTDFDLFLKTPIAHRGIFGDGVGENTIEAIVNAVSRGFGVEIDVHLTLDSVPVVVHDTNLNRLCGVDKNVNELTFAQLLDTKLLTGETIPTFEKVLEVVGAKVPLLVEFKVDGKNEKPLVDLSVALLKNYDKRMVAFQSFYPQCVRYATKTYPEILSGQLSSGNIDLHGNLIKKIFYTLFVMHFSRGAFVSYDVNFLPNKYVQRYRKHGGKVLCWLVNNQQKLLIARQCADNVIFEDIF